MNKRNLLSILVEDHNLKEKISIGLIMSGKVLVNEKIITKPYILINEKSIVRIKGYKTYVSRGAYKLLTAFKNSVLDVSDKICMDIGSSTGGFTEVLLEKKAKKVYSIDSGTNQLDYKLRINEKVISLENINIRNLKQIDIPDKIDFACMDLSFTSSVNIIFYIFKEFSILEAVCLIKPQFEFDRLKKVLDLKNEFNGIVSDECDRGKILDHIKNEIESAGLKVENTIESEIQGAMGNKEYLFFIKKV